MNLLRVAGLTVVLAVMGCGMAVAQDAAQPAGKMKTKSNIKNDRAASPADKTKGNIKDNATSGPAETGTNKTKGNVKDNVAQPVDAVRVKSHSNSTNNRMAGGSTPGTADAAGAKSHSNTNNNREAGAAPTVKPVEVARVKSHSNQSNNRMAAGGGQAASGTAQGKTIKSHSNSANNKQARGGTQ